MRTVSKTLLCCLPFAGLVACSDGGSTQSESPPEIICLTQEMLDAPLQGDVIAGNSLTLRVTPPVGAEFFLLLNDIDITGQLSPEGAGFAVTVDDLADGEHRIAVLGAGCEALTRNFSVDAIKPFVEVSVDPTTLEAGGVASVGLRVQDELGFELTAGLDTQIVVSGPSETGAQVLDAGRAIRFTEVGSYTVAASVSVAGSPLCLGEDPVAQEDPPEDDPPADDPEGPCSRSAEVVVRAGPAAVLGDLELLVDGAALTETELDAGTTLWPEVALFDAFGNCAPGDSGGCAVASPDVDEDGVLDTDVVWHVTPAEAGVITAEGIQLFGAGNVEIVAEFGRTGHRTAPRTVTINPLGIEAIGIEAPMIVPPGVVVPIALSAEDAFGNASNNFTPSLVPAEAGDISFTSLRIDEPGCATLRAAARGVGGVVEELQVRADASGPNLNLDAPPSGAFIDPLPFELGGRAWDSAANACGGIPRQGVVGITLNGVPVGLDPFEAVFEQTYVPTFGLNVLSFELVDDIGLTSFGSRAYLAGAFLERTEPVALAVRSQTGVDALAAVLEPLLAEGLAVRTHPWITLPATVPPGEVDAGDDAEVGPNDVTRISYDGATALVEIDGDRLVVTLEMSGLEINGNVEVSMLFESPVQTEPLDFRVTRMGGAAVRYQQAFSFSIDGDTGALSAVADQAEVEVDDVEFLRVGPDVRDEPDADPRFRALSVSYLQRLLIGSGLGAALQRVVESVGRGLRLPDEVPVGEGETLLTTLNVTTRFAESSVGGGALTVDLPVLVVPAVRDSEIPVNRGSLVREELPPSLPGELPVEQLVSENHINQALFALWESGSLGWTSEIPGGVVTLTARMPPVVSLPAGDPATADAICDLGSQHSIGLGGLECEVNARLTEDEPLAARGTVHMRAGLQLSVDRGRWLALEPQLDDSETVANITESPAGTPAALWATVCADAAEQVVPAALADLLRLPLAVPELDATRFGLREMTPTVLETASVCAVAGHGYVRVQGALALESGE